jgi:hypothetical protein
MGERTELHPQWIGSFLDIQVIRRSFDGDVPGRLSTTLLFGIVILFFSR